MNARYFAIDVQNGTLLHVLNGEDESARFMRHHERSEGSRPALVRWTPGRVEVVEEGSA